MSVFQKIILFLKARYAPRGARVTFSQYGEDIVMKDILKKNGIQNISYIDIGAHHPYFGNNTFLLYKAGGKGVLVEPNANLSNLIKRVRPRDICLNVGAGGEAGEVDFYEFSQSTRSTFSKQQADEHAHVSGQKARIEKKPIVSLDSIIVKYFEGEAPSVVSIDAEGLDKEILTSFSWSKRPKIFCVEISDGDREIETLMKMKGYELKARMFQNGIFVDNK